MGNSNNRQNWNSGSSGASQRDDAFWSYLDAQNQDAVLAPTIPTTYKEYMLESKKLIHWLKSKYGVPHSEAILNRIKKFTGLGDSHIEAFERVREGFDGIFSEAPDNKLLFMKVPPYGTLRDDRAKEAKAVYNALLNIKKDLEIHPAWLILEQEEKEIISDYELFENDELITKADSMVNLVNSKLNSNQELDPRTTNGLGNLIFRMVKKNDMMKNRLNSGVRVIKYLFGILKEEGVIKDIKEINNLIERSASELAKINEESIEDADDKKGFLDKVKVWNKPKRATPSENDISRKVLLLVGLKQRMEEIKELWKDNHRTTQHLRKKYLAVLVWGKNGISKAINTISKGFVTDIQTDDPKKRQAIIEKRKEQFREELIESGYLTEEELHLIIIGDLNTEVATVPGGKIFSIDVNKGILNAEKLLDHIEEMGEAE